MDQPDSPHQGPRPATPSGYAPTLTAKEHHRVISALGIKKANTRVWQLGLLGGGWRGCTSVSAAWCRWSP